ncbi:MAG: SPFH domain-containing protein [Phycisphaerales bacterium]
MRTDHTTYAIATKVSLGGLALQIIAGVILLAFGLATRDQVAWGASFYVLAGSIVWITLAILFHQHKLERIEAIESEEIVRAGERGGSIFEVSEEDLAVAARRLRGMYRVLVPVVSLIVAAVHVGLGVYLYRYYFQTRWVSEAAGTRADLPSLQYAEGAAASWGIAITAGIAAVLFIFSRYVSGMSKQPAWSNLRGGAAVSVGTALVGAVLALSYSFVVTGNEFLIHLVSRLLPFFIGFVGLEIAVNFVLNIYRPRRPGEIPRPAFDSRVLSLLATPDSVVKSINDAINYQFGFEVTSTWAYQLLARLVIPLVAFLVALIVVLNGAAVVEPHEQAIVTRFGKRVYADRVLDSGIVFKWPWDQVESYPVYRIHEVTVGHADNVELSDGPLLWGEAHTTGAEDLIIVRPTALRRSENDGDSGRDERVVRDFAVLNAEVPVHYRIKTGMDDAPGGGQRPGLINYVEFVAGERNRDELLTALATRIVHRYAASLRIDEILGDRRADMPNELQQLIQAELDAMHAGLEVVFVGVAGIHPPVGEELGVVEAFEEVLKAREEREASIQEARAEAIKALSEVAGDEQTARRLVEEIERLETLRIGSDEYAEQEQVVANLLVAAGGTAATTLYDAKARRWEMTMGQWARTIRHNSRLARFIAAPDLYMAREYYGRLVEALAAQKVFIVPRDYPVRPSINLEEDTTTVNLGVGIEDEQNMF